MKTFAYNVYVNVEESRAIYETNNVYDAITIFMDRIGMGYACSIISGFTGEVFVSNDGEYCITDEWALMINGWIIEQLWG